MAPALETAYDALDPPAPATEPGDRRGDDDRAPRPRSCGGSNACNSRTRRRGSRRARSASPRPWSRAASRGRPSPRWRRDRGGHRARRPSCRWPTRPRSRRPRCTRWRAPGRPRRGSMPRPPPRCPCGCRPPPPLLSWAMRWAAPLPMPLPPPVTNTALPASRSSWAVPRSRFLRSSDIPRVSSMARPSGSLMVASFAQGFAPFDPRGEGARMELLRDAIHNCRAMCRITKLHAYDDRFHGGLAARVWGDNGAF